MPDPVSSGLSAEGLASFFREAGIDDFVTCPVSGIHAPSGRHPGDLLATAQTIIIFGRMMPDRMFYGTAREKARETVLIKERLESVSRNLTMLLRNEGHPSVAVLPALPLNIRDGIIRGTLSLKHCAQDAGLGNMGDNSLLISSRYGNRLALAAVVTQKEMPVFPDTPAVPLCDHCGLCSTMCPTGALRDGKVDITRCRNLAHFAPGPLLTIVTGAMQWPLSAALISGLVNTFGNHVRISAACSACMISCPHFHKEER